MFRKSGFFLIKYGFYLIYIPDVTAISRGKHKIRRRGDKLNDKTGFRMDQTIKILLDRLVGKGIAPGTIPAYIRDLFNTISMNTNLMDS